MSAPGNEELSENESAQIYYLDGHFGIGTQEPKAKLHLSAGGLFGDLKIFSPKEPGADLAYDGGTDNVFYFDNYGADSGTTNFRHGNRDLLVIKNDGNIGIGTPSPSQRFHVAGGNGVVNNVFLGDVGHGPDWAGFSHASATNPTAYGFLQHSSGQYSLINKRSGGGHIGFRIDNQDKMIMKDDGTLKLLADSNPLWITAGWGGNPDAPTNVAEISNDVEGFKTLMIVGNRSAGMGRRVSVWDRFEVNGTFVNNSSIATKQDVRMLADEDYRNIYEKLTQTPLYHYRFRANGIDCKSRIGVISEESPVEILDETGKYVSLLDYLGFLFVAIKAQAREIKKLEGMLSSLARS
ncbi:MAG: hypothetical protein MRJ68_05630 [Nitrospira sp.]|nr:hypothetical protein [Nitrospira sp.]